jgi:hypothetical protein
MVVLSAIQIGTRRARAPRFFYNAAAASIADGLYTRFTNPAPARPLCPPGATLSRWAEFFLFHYQ